MRKITKSIDFVKQEIEKLKGQSIKMQVNLGRKKMVNYEGVVEDIYNSVFVVRIVSEMQQNNLLPADSSDKIVTSKTPIIPKKQSYSFSDVLCGDVKIAIKKQQKEHIIQTKII